MTEDWIDTVWVTPSYWEVADAYPTRFEDDLAFVSSWSSDLYNALTGANNLSAATSAVSTLVGGASISDEVQADILAEVGALAVSSANYWDPTSPPGRKNFATMMAQTRFVQMQRWHLDRWAAVTEEWFVRICE